MVKWLMDVRITRRQYMQHVFDMNDTLLFSSQRPSQVITWLKDNDERIVQCETEAETWWMTLSQRKNVTTP